MRESRGQDPLDSMPLRIFMLCKYPPITQAASLQRTATPHPPRPPSCASWPRADILVVTQPRAENFNVVVRSYMEALGLLAAHKAGVNPACLTPEITPIRDLEVYMEDLEDPPANDD